MKENKSLDQIVTEIDNELTIDTKTGYGYISKRGLAKFLGVSHSVIGGSRISGRLAEMLTAQGFDPSAYPIPDLAIPIYAEYFGFLAQKTSSQAIQVLRAFSAVGIRTWIHKIKGYDSSAEKVDLYKRRVEVETIRAMLNVYDYANDKPGLDRIVNFASNSDKSTLSGLITLEDVLKERDETYSISDRKALGMYVATQYRSFTGKKPKTVYVETLVGDKVRKTKVSAYPCEYKPIIENAIDFALESSFEE